MPSGAEYIESLQDAIYPERDFAQARRQVPVSEPWMPSDGGTPRLQQA